MDIVKSLENPNFLSIGRSLSAHFNGWVMLCEIGPAGNLKRYAVPDAFPDGCGIIGSSSGKLLFLVAIANCHEACFIEMSARNLAYLDICVESDSGIMCLEDMHAIFLSGHEILEWTSYESRSHDIDHKTPGFTDRMIAEGALFRPELYAQIFKSTTECYEKYSPAKGRWISLNYAAPI